MGYTLQQKIDICLMAEEHPKWKQKDLAKWCQQTYHTVKKPSQTTISRILARKDQLISMKENKFKFVRKRKLTNPLLRKILQEWISQSAWNGIPITPPIIQDTASSVWQKIPNDFRDGNGSFSYKWCALFLSKFNINIAKLDKELARPGKIWTFEERHLLKTILCRIPPKDLFTLDETFLAYNLPLDVSYYEISKIKRQIDIVTVMLCCNVDGSEKLDPLIIGRYQNYQCFLDEFPNLYKNNSNQEGAQRLNIPGLNTSRNNQNYQHRQNNGPNGNNNTNSNNSSNNSNNNNRNSDHGRNGYPGDTSLGNNNPSNAPDDLFTKVSSKYGISYQSNRESFLTSTLFHEWLIQWDKKLASGKEDRKIYIILDDCCSHRTMNVKLTNITLIFTRKQSKFLPFNWGVLDEFKTRYRVQQYEALINLQNMLSANVLSSSSHASNTPNGSVGTPNGLALTPGVNPQIRPHKVILSNEQSRINICNAFKLIKRSWQSISSESIKSNWKCSGILPYDYIQLKDNVSMGLRKNEFHLKLLNELSNELVVWKKWDYEILMDLNLENISASFLSLQEIITSAIVDRWEPIKRVIDLEEFDGDELAIGALDQELNEIINGVSPSLNTDINFNGVHAGVTDISKTGDLTVKALIDGTDLDLVGFNANQTNSNHRNFMSLIPGIDDPQGFTSGKYFNKEPGANLFTIESSIQDSRVDLNLDEEDEDEEDFDLDEDDEDDDEDDDDDDVMPGESMGFLSKNRLPQSGYSASVQTPEVKQNLGSLNNDTTALSMMLTSNAVFHSNNEASPFSQTLPVTGLNKPMNMNAAEASSRLPIQNSDFENTYLREQLGGLGGSNNISHYNQVHTTFNNSAQAGSMNVPVTAENYMSAPQNVMAQPVSSNSSNFVSPQVPNLNNTSVNQNIPLSGQESAPLTSIQECYEMNKKIANTLVTLLKHAEFGDIEMSNGTLQELRTIYKTSVSKVRKNRELFLKQQQPAQLVNQLQQPLQNQGLQRPLMDNMPFDNRGNTSVAQQTMFYPNNNTLIPARNFMNPNVNRSGTHGSTPGDSVNSPNVSLHTNHST